MKRYLPVLIPVTHNTSSNPVSDIEGPKGTGSTFLELPKYHLLFDALLVREQTLDIYVCDLRLPPNKDETIYLLSIMRTQNGFDCKPSIDMLENISLLPGSDVDPRDRLVSALVRCGLLLSPRWEEVCKMLGSFDDVIIGLDTNVLQSCVVSQQLFDGFTLTTPAPHLHTPNWLLLVVPSAVMHEIEQAANLRNDRGLLRHAGRIGYLALQEILELDQSKDMAGASLLIAGQANPILDTRVEIQGHRREMQALQESSSQTTRAAAQSIPTYKKLLSGDTLIRDEFKCFLRQIGFHKGAPS